MPAGWFLARRWPGVGRLVPVLLFAVLALVFELVEVLDQVGVVSALAFDVGEVAAVVFGGLFLAGSGVLLGVEGESVVVGIGFGVFEHGGEDFDGAGSGVGGVGERRAVAERDEARL